MLIITISVDAPAGKAIGIIEDLGMYAEKFGDTRVLDIKEVKIPSRQMEMGI